MDLGLIASHNCPPGLGAVFNPEHGFSRVPKQKDELKLRGGLLDCNNLALKNSVRSTLIDVQDIHPQSLLMGFGIAEQCTRHEKILELLASGSIEVDDDFLDLSMLYDLMGPRQLLTDSAQQPFTSCSEQCLCDTKSLVYPARELYLNEPVLNVVGSRSSCRENTFHHMADDMTHAVPAISDLYFSKNTVASSRRTLLVPYFERRRRGRPNTDSSKLTTEKVAPPKSHVKVKAKTSQKRKTSPKMMKERDISCKSYLHACESLLSIIVNRKQQGGNATISLKKSSPQLTAH
ncbi:uncharacterized protein LOC130998981 isoform X2 [Salvia miltiorrhiza]|uniref:uncharacterized protein LOC130998981 isoform X2 n=1 Tax=Salvia miltiorrhiza TaxID=226208 RepID=UPI0025AD0214|nr:uncharacterized protein LOC130998981 isoform X2 [Salvia miltiorrhiza]